MTQADSALNKIQERMAEKDEVINEQMLQIVQLEDQLETLHEENESLLHIKREYERIKKVLDSLTGG